MPERMELRCEYFGGLDSGAEMAAKKYYAVKRGKTEGIFYTWEECRASVEGCPGAEYKGFASLKEAESYLGTGKPGAKKPGTGKKAAGAGIPDEFPEPGTLLAYVDGSYDDSMKKYAFGCVFLLPDGRKRAVPAAPQCDRRNAGGHVCREDRHAKRLRACGDPL